MAIITDEEIARLTVSYLDAALNKLEVAAYHQTRLADRLRSGEAARVEVQAYFEGLLYAGVAATDQVAEVLNRAFALRLERPNLRRALGGLAGQSLDQDAEALIFDFRRWLRRAEVREAGKVRWRATHHFYPKSVRDGIWQYEASDGIGVEEGGSVGLLAEKYASDLHGLSDLVERLARVLGVEQGLRELRQNA
jgi:hypothetical protein